MSGGAGKLHADAGSTSAREREKGSGLQEGCVPGFGQGEGVL